MFSTIFGSKIDLVPLSNRKIDLFDDFRVKKSTALYNNDEVGSATTFTSSNTLISPASFSQNTLNMPNVTSHGPMMLGKQLQGLNVHNSLQSLGSVSVNSPHSPISSSCIGENCQNFGNANLKSPNYFTVNKHLLSMVRSLNSSKLSAYTLGNNAELTKLLSNLDDWQGIDVRKIADASDNRPLTIVTWAIFEKRDFFKTFGIDKKKMLTYLLHVEDAYHDCHYHNRLHAADVAHSVHVLLNTSNICSSFSDLEMFQNFFI